MSSNDPFFGSRRDAFDTGVGLSQLLQGITSAKNLEEVSRIRALLEQESRKGNARARELEALLRKHTCSCKGSPQASTCGWTNSAGLWRGRSCSRQGGRFLESQLTVKERMNLEPLTVTCPACRGNGRTSSGGTCLQCEGRGEEVLYGTMHGIDIHRLKNNLKRRSESKDSTYEPVYNCPKCNGTQKVPCNFCNGTGIINRAEYEKEIQRIEARYR